MRASDTYRGARRNAARKERLVWRELPRRVGKSTFAPTENIPRIGTAIVLSKKPATTKEKA